MRKPPKKASVQERLAAKMVKSVERGDLTTKEADARRQERSNVGNRRYDRQHPSDRIPNAPWLNTAGDHSRAERKRRPGQRTS